MPTGDAESSYERECNEGRYERSHQKEYLKWDLQESKDLPLLRRRLAKRPSGCSVLSPLSSFLLSNLLPRQLFALTEWASTFQM